MLGKKNSGSKTREEFPRGWRAARTRLKELTGALKPTPIRALPRPMKAPQGLSYPSQRRLRAASECQRWNPPSLCLSRACHSHSGPFLSAAITHSILPFYRLLYSIVTHLSSKGRHIDGHSSVLAALPLRSPTLSLGVTWFWERSVKKWDPPIRCPVYTRYFLFPVCSCVLQLERYSLVSLQFFLCFNRFYKAAEWADMY